MNPDYIIMNDIVDVWWEWNEPQTFFKQRDIIFGRKWGFLSFFH